MLELAIGPGGDGRWGGREKFYYPGAWKIAAMLSSRLCFF